MQTSLFSLIPNISITSFRPTNDISDAVVCESVAQRGGTDSNRLDSPDLKLFLSDTVIYNVVASLELNDPAQMKLKYTWFVESN